MEATVEKCVFCSVEPVMGFCENCNCKLGSNCFQNHKKVPIFADHVIFPFEDLHPCIYVESGVIKLTNDSKEETDMHYQNCKIHESEKTRMYCENHNVAICVRCLRLNHKDCINETTDLLDIKMDELNVTESLSVIEELDQEITQTENDIAENVQLNNVCRSIFKREIEAFFLKLAEQLSLMKNKADEVGSVRHNLNSNALSKLTVECEDVRKIVSEKKKLIEKLVEKKHQERLYVAMRKFHKETRDMKTKLRNVGQNNNIQQFSFKPNDALQQALFSANSVIGTLQETANGSDECQLQVQSAPVVQKPALKDIRIIDPVSGEDITDKLKPAKSWASTSDSSSRSIPVNEGVVSVSQANGNWRSQYSTLCEYQTPSTIKVFVYKASICHLHVDCIVSGSNDRLNCGGVSNAIARSAGDELTKEADMCIKTHGPIPVGEVVVTTAGRLNYQCVIHAVGPKWLHYDTSRLEGIESCGLHLYNAVLNSFIEANERGLRSVALPAISSERGGVPMKYCTVQYAKAVLDFCQRYNNTSSLQEIHFVDINLNTVDTIQKTFDCMIRNKKPEPYNARSFLSIQNERQRSLQKETRRIEKGKWTTSMSEAW